MRRAAYFELRADYFGRPFDDGILCALAAAGYQVDVFAPDGDGEQDIYPHVRRRDVSYRREWLQGQCGRSAWRRYDLFLGTADLPMAFAGALAAAARRPIVTACDEIYTGGHQGAATLYWKAVTRWAMRRAIFTIITDEARIPLQREYAGLRTEHEFLSYPSYYVAPYDGRTRVEARRILGIPDDAFVVSFMGAFTAQSGADWAVRLLDRGSTRLLVQTGGPPDPALGSLLERLAGATYRPQRLGWRASGEITIAADVGLAIYLSRKPEFQLMGLSSQKLCTCLWLGLPVVATRQDSFRFVEDYRCGELIDDASGLEPALERIRGRRDEYVANGARAVRDYVRPDERLRLLTERLRGL